MLSEYVRPALNGRQSHELQSLETSRVQAVPSTTFRYVRFLSQAYSFTLSLRQASYLGGFPAWPEGRTFESRMRSLRE